MTHTKWNVKLCGLMLWLLLVTTSCLGELLYVSPTGNDVWTGRLDKPNAEGTDGPLASLTGARDRIRQLKLTVSLTEPVRVIVAGGDYRLDQPLILEAQDSGTAQYPIVYEAAPQAKPVFSGGHVINGFRPYKDGIWQTRVSTVADGNWHFEQLFVDGRRATRARTPNQFYFYMQTVREE
jgi:hypothetical protein